LNGNEIFAALAEGSIEPSFLTAHTVDRGANTVPTYQEPLVDALTHGAFALVQRAFEARRCSDAKVAGEHNQLNLLVRAAA
jgi:hypothetical protein